MSKADAYPSGQVPENGGPVLLSRLEVARLTGLSPATIDRYRRRQAFPQPIQLGPNRVAWLLTEIYGWIATRVAERDERSNPREGSS